MKTIIRVKFFPVSSFDTTLLLHTARSFDAHEKSLFTYLTILSRISVNNTGLIQSLLLPSPSPSSSFSLLQYSFSGEHSKETEEKVKINHLGLFYKVDTVNLSFLLYTGGICPIFFSIRNICGVFEKNVSIKNKKKLTMLQGRGHILNVFE